MKTFKLMLAVIFVSCSFVVMAQNETPKERERQTINIPIRSAICHYDLVRAMYDQVDQSFLNNEFQKLYTARVVHNNVVYLISGKYEEWTRFFLMDRIPAIPVSKGKKP